MPVNYLHLISSLLFVPLTVEPGALDLCVRRGRRASVLRKDRQLARRLSGRPPPCV